MNDVVIVAIVFIAICGAIGCFGSAIIGYIYRPKLEPLGKYKIMLRGNPCLQAIFDNGVKFSESDLQKVRDYLARQNSRSVSERREN